MGPPILLFFFSVLKILFSLLFELNNQLRGVKYVIQTISYPSIELQLDEPIHGPGRSLMER